MILQLFEIVFVACIAAWFILFLGKTGLREWLIVNADYFVQKVIKSYDGSILNHLFSCDFCTSWWTCCVLSLIYALWTHDPLVLLYPFVATPLTRKLL